MAKTWVEIKDPHRDESIVALIPTRDGYVMATASNVYVITPHGDGTNVVQPMEFVDG